ncbi:MAG TPA: methionine synthase [Candidatus Binatia bacterium]|jgi:5-methyltetrahydropteroyltriglutamate--homocysteine methyltransferase|nr:methionine synthase [Candidatus Binatia bacterium]
MQRSEHRILTTHTGSLPRPASLAQLLVQQEQQQPLDPSELAREIDTALDFVVRQQLNAGVDIGNDGEIPRIGFSTYVAQRMTGFGGVSARKSIIDTQKFPEYADFLRRQVGTPGQGPRVWNAPQAVTAVCYDPTLSEAKREQAAFAACLQRQPGRFVETFMSAASPGILSTTLLRAPHNPAYPSDEDYVLALAREMRREYEYVVAQGHILQLDAPDLAMERIIMFGDRPLQEFLERVDLHIRAINVAVENIPRDRVRLHVCWGNYQGPHQDDVALEEILPRLYQAKVGALSIPFGNPRHEHETALFRKYPPPPERLIIAGVIDVTTNYLEHPKVVAKRIGEVVEAVGDRSRVLAGTDCGFGTFATFEFITRDVVWAKLKTLSEGAAIASARLW